MKQCYYLKLWVNIYSTSIERLRFIRRPQKYDEISQLTWNLLINMDILSSFSGLFCKTSTVAPFSSTTEVTLYITLITKLNYHDVVVGAAAGNGAGKVNWSHLFEAFSVKAMWIPPSRCMWADIEGLASVLNSVNVS